MFQETEDLAEMMDFERTNAQAISLIAEIASDPDDIQQVMRDTLRGVLSNISWIEYRDGKVIFGVGEHQKRTLAVSELPSSSEYLDIPLREDLMFMYSVFLGYNYCHQSVLDHIKVGFAKYQALSGGPFIMKGDDGHNGVVRTYISLLRTAMVSTEGPMGLLANYEYDFLRRKLQEFIEYCMQGPPLLFANMSFEDGAGVVVGASFTKAANISLPNVMDFDDDDTLILIGQFNRGDKEVEKLLFIGGDSLAYEEDFIEFALKGESPIFNPEIVTEKTAWFIFRCLLAIRKDDAVQFATFGTDGDSKSSPSETCQESKERADCQT